MLRFASALLVIILVFACQTPNNMPARNTAAPRLDRGPQVDASVRAHQDLWLKGLVLDPDQTGVHTLAVLGDTYSDTGSLFERSRTLAPPQVYWRSRFSNGPIWVDYVQGALGWSIRNYTFVDSEPGEALSRIPGTNLQAQVDRLQREMKQANREQILVSIWIGPDFYQEKSSLDSVPAVIAEIKKALVALDGLGFHRIAVGNLPDLSQWPLAASPKTPAARREFWKKVAVEHNEALKSLLEQLKKERLDLRAYMFQTFEIQKISREKAESAGIALKPEACYSGDARGVFEGERRFCPNPASTQYWDTVHPNSKLHCFYAAQFLSDTADAEHIGGYNKGQAVDHCQQL